jgi:hypothetical protein
VNAELTQAFGDDSPRHLLFQTGKKGPHCLDDCLNVRSVSVSRIVITVEAYKS